MCERCDDMAFLIEQTRDGGVVESTFPGGQPVLVKPDGTRWVVRKQKERKP